MLRLAEIFLNIVSTLRTSLLLILGAGVLLFCALAFRTIYNDRRRRN